MVPRRLAQHPPDLPHERDRREVVPDHITDRDGHRLTLPVAGTAKRDRVVPVAPHVQARVRGPVAGGHRQPVDGGQDGQHGRLQLADDLLLPLLDQVAAPGLDTGVVPGQPQPKLGRTGAGDVVQRGEVVVGPVPRSPVDRAQRAEDPAPLVGQGDTRIGDDAEIRDREVVPHERMCAGVVDHQRLRRRDDVLAERMRQRRRPLGGSRLRQADHPREDLSVDLDQRHQCRRHTERPAYPVRDAVHLGVGRRTEPGPGQCQQPSPVAHRLLGVRVPARPGQPADHRLAHNRLLAHEVGRSTTRRTAPRPEIGAGPSDDTA